MILDKIIYVKMNAKHISKYREMGYDCVVGELTPIKIEDLPKYSKSIVLVSCDICENNSTLNYNIYNKSIEKNGFYRCVVCGRESAKKTCLFKYGVDNPTKLKKISEKISINYKNKSDFEKELMKENQKNTSFDKYGTWFVNTSSYKKKVKETSIEKYGVDDYRKSDVFKNKVRDIIYERYGVLNLSHMTHEFKKSWFGNKINGLHQPSNLKYQGTYELDFIEKYYNKVVIEKINPIQYKLNENNHYYHPDFYLPKYNLIVEVKSSYTYESDLDKNLAKKEYSIKNGFNFIFIIDKNYSELESILLESTPDNQIISIC
jgi:hypothetical protein